MDSSSSSSSSAKGDFLAGGAAAGFGGSATPPPFGEPLTAVFFFPVDGSSAASPNVPGRASADGLSSGSAMNWFPHFGHLTFLPGGTRFGVFSVTPHSGFGQV